MVTVELLCHGHGGVQHPSWGHIFPLVYNHLLIAPLLALSLFYPRVIGLSVQISLSCPLFTFLTMLLGMSAP